MTYIEKGCGGAQPRRKKAFGSQKWQRKKNKQKHEKRPKRNMIVEGDQQCLPVTVVDKQRYVLNTLSDCCVLFLQDEVSRNDGKISHHLEYFVRLTTHD